ncbi:MAG: Peptidase protein [Patescibacteria group bacterium]|nr:Peptidase protein [Patescibacteria group bacterium]
MRRTPLLSIFLLIAAAVPSWASAGGFVYPFDKIAATSCKWNSWSTLGDDCKIDLPKITGAEYSKFEKNQLYRRVYSVLYGATYDYGWDTGYGSHGGVDIATSDGTPVRSIGDGTVAYASWATGWGNVVAVKHTLTDGAVIYSNYAHLSKISVKKGQAVLAADNVGEVGNTGNSYGNHLHFQIDVTDQAHPYYYSTCAKGMDPMSVVNKGLCRDWLSRNTIDPIAFLESGKVAIPGVADSTVIEAVRNKPTERPDRTSMKTRAEIQEEEIQEFLKKNSISIGLSENGTNVMAGGTVWASVTSGDSRGKATRGNFPELGLDIVFDTKGLSVFPQKIVALDGGRRDFKITGIKPGVYEIAFKMGQTVIARRTVVVLSATDAKTTATAEIRAPGTLFLGEDKNLLVVMKTKYGTPLLDSKFDGRYKLSLLKGKAKFCNVSFGSKTACRSENLVEELEFSYADTYR